MKRSDVKQLVVYTIFFLIPASLLMLFLRWLTCYLIAGDFHVYSNLGVVPNVLLNVLNIYLAAAIAKPAYSRFQKRQPSNHDNHC